MKDNEKARFPIRLTEPEATAVDTVCVSSNQETGFCPGYAFHSKLLMYLKKSSHGSIQLHAICTTLCEKLAFRPSLFSQVAMDNQLQFTFIYLSERYTVKTHVPFLVTSESIYFPTSRCFRTLCSTCHSPSQQALRCPEPERSDRHFAPPSRRPSPSSRPPLSRRFRFAS